MKNDKKMLYGIMLAFLLLLSIGLSYAWFSVNVEGNNLAKDIKTSTGSLDILYNAGNEIILEKAYPGDTITKTFTVENVGTLPTSYNISLVDTYNDILYDELVISYVSTNAGANLYEHPACTSNCNLSENVPIDVGVTHEYEVTLHFKEMYKDQNYNQNKSFHATINITSANDNGSVTYKNLVDSMNEAAASYVLANNIESNTYIPINELGLGSTNGCYSNSSGVAVTVDEDNFSYKSYLSCPDYKNYNANENPNSTTKVSLLGANPYLMNDTFDEPGYIAKDGYMVVAKDTNSIPDGESLLTYNIYKDNLLVDTISRKIFKSNTYTDYTISCEGEIKNGNTTLNISSTNPIDAYDVFSNYTLVGNSNSSTYVINGKTKNVYINLTDTSGNSMQKKCNITDYDYPLEIHMIDMGYYAYGTTDAINEESILIRNDNSSILIDAGQYVSGNVVKNYLTSLGITNIDLMVATHLDFNHIQGEAVILDNFNVENMFINDDLFNCEANDRCDAGTGEYLIDSLNAKNMTPLIMEDGDEIGLNGFIIKCIAPKVLYTTDEITNADNKNSINFILKYKNIKTLLTGDALMEENVLSEYSNDELNIDILKYPHHGNYNLSENMINILSPSTTIIGNGWNILHSYYQNSETYLNNVGSSIYMTGYSDNYVVKTDGNTISVDEMIYPSSYNRDIAHSYVERTATDFATDYATLGMARYTHNATVAQNYDTVEYRYQGSNPNNYILFNNNEFWRIIGVFDVEDGLGNKETRFKIMRDERLSSAPFDTNGSNNYSTSSIKTLLNEGDYFNRLNDYDERGLTAKAKTQIANAVWYIGGHSTNAVTSNDLYNYERGSVSSTWTGLVGLINASDYGYASNNCANNMIDEDNYKIAECIDNNYMRSSTRYFQTLTPSSIASGDMFAVRASGYVSNGGDVTSSTYYARPVVYLKANTKLIGSGTVGDPFSIK